MFWIPKILIKSYRWQLMGVKWGNRLRKTIEVNNYVGQSLVVQFFLQPYFDK